MLRSCGRALFREVGRRWQSGVVNYGRRRGPTTIQLRDKQRDIAELAVVSREAAENAILLQKTHSIPEGNQIYGVVWMEYFVYMCNLAESMGFVAVLGDLEEVWAKTPCRWMITPPEFKYANNSDDVFRRGRVQSIDDADFFHIFRPNNINKLMYKNSCAESIKMKAVPLLGKEILAAVWLAFFLLDFDMAAYRSNVDPSTDYNRVLLNFLNRTEECLLPQE